MITTDTPRASTTAVEQVRSLRWGVPAVAFAAGLAAFSVYVNLAGTSAADRNSQESALPVIIGVAVVLGALAFGLVAPRVMRGTRMSGWALGFAIAAIVTLAGYWSGLPVVFGVAALLLGTTGRRLRLADGLTARLALAATILGAIAIPLDIAATIYSVI
jgi:hypothetical protein